MPAFLLILCIGGCGIPNMPTITALNSKDECTAVAESVADTISRYDIFCYDTKKQIVVSAWSRG